MHVTQQFQQLRTEVFNLHRQVACNTLKQSAKQMGEIVKKGEIEKQKSKQKIKQKKSINENMHLTWSKRRRHRRLRQRHSH